MGLGDWIMATAQVREMNERTGRPVVVVDRMGRPRWSEVFENNPRIVREFSRASDRLLNAGGARPYIRAKTTTHWFWQRWDIKPGELYLSDAERSRAFEHGDRVLVEPNTKVLNGNKAWPFERWQAVVASLDLPWIQVGPAGTRRLSGVRFVETETAREAFAILSWSRLFVGTEGALHHAAAALGVRAVVLWSEFISPVITGYATQHNLRKTSAVCGSRMPCATCRASMAAITVEEVRAAITEELAA